MGEDDRVVAVRSVDSAGWRIVVEADQSVLEGPAYDDLIVELVLLAAALALVALIAAGIVARRIGRLHRSALRQTSELAALERLTAALTQARSSDDVAEAVHDLGPTVIGAQQMALVTSRDTAPTAPDNAAANGPRLDVTRHRSSRATGRSSRRSAIRPHRRWNASAAPTRSTTSPSSAPRWPEPRPPTRSSVRSTSTGPSSPGSRPSRPRSWTESVGCSSATATR